MYPVSNAFLEAVKTNTRKYYWTGRSTTTAGTVYEFVVKVSISDLNIRKGPGTDYNRVQFCPVGIYTIMEVGAGQGSKAGWGRLKSGIGWISLDFVNKV